MYLKYLMPVPNVPERRSCIIGASVLSRGISSMSMLADCSVPRATIDDKQKREQDAPNPTVMVVALQQQHQASHA
jgi:hypothetical protein